MCTTTHPTVLWGCVGMCVVGLFSRGPAALAAEPGGAPPKLETRVFDVRSLLLEVPDYRAIFSDLRSDDLYLAPQAPNSYIPPTPSQISTPAPSAATPSAPAPDPAAKNVEVLMEMIRGVIAPDSWRTNGGDDGAMYAYAGQLVVCQTPAVMAEVEQLLNLLKAARALKLRLDARFVIVPAGSQLPAVVAGFLAQHELSPEQLRKFVEDPSAKAEVVPISLTAFEGQRVCASSGQQFSVLIGATAVVASEIAAYQPGTRVLLSGVTLEAQSVLDPNQGNVLVDLRAALGRFALPEGGLPAPADSLAILVGIPPYQTAHFATSVSLPMDRFSMIGTTHYDETRDVVLWVMPSRQ